ncbi:MAG: hypothetical protein MK086_02790 [Flavobacteriales bacterium]|nr:hypothetical protein [Flavobacteriales bacterium]
MTNQIKKKLLWYASSIIFLASCGEKSIERGEVNAVIEIDSAKANIVNISGELFSIPSPIQTSLLIQNSKAAYRPDLLSNVEGYKQHQTNSAKALNLGVFGTDMAYSSIYEDGQKALEYFKAVNYLANDLGISGSISPALIKRLGANADNPDSLLTLTGRFYEEGDAYLKKNERYDIASFIILGGWIESSLLTSKSALDRNEVAKIRLAEQQASSATINEILDKTTGDEFQSSDLATVLDSIADAFAQVESSYAYTAPIINPDTKTTRLTSRTEHSMSDSLLTSIHQLLVSAKAKISEQ